jgi:hypothetical protein
MLFFIYDDFPNQTIYVYITIVELDEDMSKDSFVHEMPVYEFRYEQIDDIYCCKLEIMEWEDRTIFFKLLVDSFSYKNLNTY